MFQEFTKALYLAGDVEAVYVIVADAAQEQSARADGYKPIGEQAVEAPVRRTRGPNKAK